MRRFFDKINKVFTSASDEDTQDKTQDPGLTQKTSTTHGAADVGFMLGLGDPKKVGRYEIVKKLGQGGAGVVYLGRDPYIKRNVAIKISHPSSERSREKFFTEAQSAGRLNHPNIVAIHDAGVYKDFCYITIEYIEGPTLEDNCRYNNLMPLNRVAEVMFSVCQAIEYAHSQGIIHRDIKPSNIMLDLAGTPKITDFGTAQMVEQTAKLGFLGTPGYMAPEQLTDSIISEATDIFSLGCVLYELLVGQQAFMGDNYFSIMYQITNETPTPLQEIRPDLPDAFREITEKAMAKDPGERYQSCTDMAFYLRTALRDLESDSRREQEALTYIHDMPFFQAFNKDQLHKLITASNIVKVRQGKTIVSQGEIDNTFYIIISGQADVKKDDVLVARLGAGECFGEMAYIAGQARVATVTAAADCILIKISATLLNRSPDSIQLLFFKNFATTLVRRLSGYELAEKQSEND